MAYDDFTLDALKRQFGLRTDERVDRFAHVPPAEISPWLRETLDQNLPLALANDTEKALSELLIMPILLEAYRQTGRGFSLFSGLYLDIDSRLCGDCDFLLSLSPEQLFVEAPVVAVMEVKVEIAGTGAGIGQCAAEMLAAQTFNARRGNPIPTVFGTVTTGSVWRFLQLTGDVVAIDAAEYHIKEVERVVGILVAMVSSLTSPLPSG